MISTTSGPTSPRKKIKVRKIRKVALREATRRLLTTCINLIMKGNRRKSKLCQTRLPKRRLSMRKREMLKLKKKRRIKREFLRNKLNVKNSQKRKQQWQKNNKKVKKIKMKVTTKLPILTTLTNLLLKNRMINLIKKTQTPQTCSRTAKNRQKPKMKKSRCKNNSKWIKTSGVTISTMKLKT